jgi:hypothetical protein
VGVIPGVGGARLAHLAGAGGIRKEARWQTCSPLGRGEVRLRTRMTVPTRKERTRCSGRER